MGRCIDTAARQSGFILSTSCEIPPRSNPEIVKWFMDAAHDYGRYERILSNRGRRGEREGRGDDHRALSDLSPVSLTRYQRNGFFEGGTP